MWAYGYHIRVEPKGRNSHVTYDCGVACVFTQECRSSRADRNPVEVHLQYVEIVKNIYEVTYRTMRRVVLKCDWIRSNYRGHPTMKRDDYGFWMVKHNARVGRNLNLYVFPLSVKQVHHGGCTIPTKMY
jgi:hypothetical protein